MQPKVALVENNLNKELIALNIIQHDYMKKLVHKTSKPGKPMDRPKPDATPFGEFPKEYLKGTKKLKENKITDSGSKKKKNEALAPRPIAPTEFRKYYERGDIPVKIIHCGSLNKIDWMDKPDEIDLKKYLPWFVEGLREKLEPFRFLAILGSFELIEKNPQEKIVECIPLLILPLKTALNTRDLEVIAVVCKFMQKLLKVHPNVGKHLVPYYRQLLPIFNIMKGCNKNIGDAIEYNQRKGLNIGDLIQETLELMETTGGEDAFINIKYMIPTYESCVYS